MNLAPAIRKAKRVYLIGNGGSYANAMHIANDLLSVGIKAYTMDPATLTAFSNDFSYEEAFARWISLVGERGDLLIALSGSGRSKNISAALRTAREVGMETILVSNYLEGIDMQGSEEQQIRIGHDAMRAIRDSR